MAISVRTKARSTSQSLDSTTIEVPTSLTHWLGVPHRKFEANYRKIAAKRGQRPSPGVDLSRPEQVRAHVERVLTDADFAFRRGGDEWDVVAIDGRGDIVGVRLATDESTYSVRTALVMDEAQLRAALLKSIEKGGADAVMWRDSHGASLVHGLLPGSETGARPPATVKQLIKKLRRAQLGQADLAIAEGRYLHTPAAAERMAEIRGDIDAARKMLPRDVDLRFVESLTFAGREANGAWDSYDRVVYVSLAGFDPVRTLRHETVHALRQSGLMSDTEFDTLWRHAESVGLRAAYGIDAAYGEVYRKAYGHLGADHVEKLLREETIADMFADRALNARRFGDGIVDRILETIVGFLKRVRDTLGLKGFRDAHDIFEAIESGAMAQRAALADVQIMEGSLKTLASIGPFRSDRSLLERERLAVDKRRGSGRTAWRSLLERSGSSVRLWPCSGRTAWRSLLEPAGHGRPRDDGSGRTAWRSLLEPNPAPFWSGTVPVGPRGDLC